MEDNKFLIILFYIITIITTFVLLPVIVLDLMEVVNISRDSQRIILLVMLASSVMYEKFKPVTTKKAFSIFIEFIKRIIIK